MYTRPFRTYKPTIHLREAEINAQPSLMSMNSVRTTSTPPEPAAPATRTLIASTPVPKPKAASIGKTRAERSDEFCIELASQADKRVRRNVLMKQYALSPAQLNYCITKGRSLCSS